MSGTRIIAQISMPLTTTTVSSGNRYTFSIENKFIITEFLPHVSQFGV